MNAPDKAAVLGHLKKIHAEFQAQEQAKELALIYAEQPKVCVLSGATELLASSYQHGYLLLDLYGELDRQLGYEVNDVTLAGSDISIVDLFEHVELSELGRWCDRNLPSYRDIQQTAQDDFNAEQRSYA